MSRVVNLDRYSTNWMSCKINKSFIEISSRLHLRFLPLDPLNFYVLLYAFF